MSIDRLRYFAAVVETKNLRKAAELVGISPPSMSKAISVLESELGLKLIHAEGRGIGITPKGLDVYRLSSTLLDEHRMFYRRLSDIGNRTERIKMASFEVFSTYFISAFIETEPTFDFLLLEIVPGKIEQAILNGTVDIGLTYVPSPDASLEYRELGAFKMGIYGQKTWEEKAFDEWPFAVPTTELQINSSSINALDMWPSKAPLRKIKYHFELLETAIQTARSGQSVIHCPDFIIELQNQHVKDASKLVKLKPPPGYKKLKPIKMYLVGRKGSERLDLERKLAKLIRSFDCVRFG